VHPADLQDRATAPWLLRHCQPSLPRLELIWADSAYLGPLQQRVREVFGWQFQVVEHPGGRGGWMRADQEPPVRLPGFHPAPHRWIRERTLAWTLAQPPDEQRVRIAAYLE
jgi:putative transposase